MVTFDELERQELEDIQTWDRKFKIAKESNDARLLIDLMDEQQRILLLKQKHHNVSFWDAGTPQPELLEIFLNKDGNKIVIDGIEIPFACTLKMVTGDVIWDGHHAEKVNNDEIILTIRPRAFKVIPEGDEENV